MSSSPLRKCYTPETLALVLGKGTLTIQADASRRPERLPPRVQIPGSRLLRWDPRVVDEWLREHSRPVDPSLPKPRALRSVPTPRSGARTRGTK
jgi:predicted DNA-binding transcriptional regulator AlpA